MMEKRFLPDSFLVGLVVLFLVGSIVPAIAVSIKKQDMLNLVLDKPGGVVHPTSAQHKKAAENPDIQVKWDADTGVPRCVRGEAIAGKNIDGKGLVLDPGADWEEQAVVVLDKLSGLYRIKDAQDEFVATKVLADKLGFHHVRIKQMYKGLRVAGADLIVHFNKKGNPYQVTGTYRPDIQLNIEAEIQADQAVNTALAFLDAEGFEGDYSVMEKPELAIYAAGVKPVLVYEFVLASRNGDEGPESWLCRVDARNGEIIDMFDQVAHQAPGSRASATITGSLVLGEGGGTVTLTGSYMTGYYWLEDDLWMIKNCDTTGSYPDSGAIARRTTADWGTSDRTEISAAYNYSLATAYFNTVHGRSGFDAAGKIAKANVHYPNLANNACWSSTYQQFFFGEPDYEEFSELVVLDVASHEFTHAVTEYTADLTYRDESGALNESFSDIFGTLVEFAYQPDGSDSYPSTTDGYADWYLGEDCSLGSIVAMRDMRNPANPHTSIADSGYPQPSRYKGTNWYTGSSDNGGVHINNSVQNFFFYLLSEGGSGQNDGITYNVTGIGITNAGQLAYRVLTVYMTSDTDHPAARTAWISAASDLDSSWVSSVEAAWDAVGVSSNTTAQSGEGALNDYNLDGASDVVVYNRSTGGWYIYSVSAGHVCNSSWGFAGAVPVSGDYDSDGCSDWVVYDETSGYWYLYLSTGQSGYIQWGGPGFSAVPGDYNNDGQADLAVYHRETGVWHIYSLGAGYLGCTSWGISGAYPVPGDYDGDGSHDLVVYERSSGYWYVYLSSGPAGYVSWGGFQYLPTSGDFDGDGKDELVAYDTTNGAWYFYSLYAGCIGYASWGYAGAVPVQGDFDGDDTADLAVYDEAAGYWYLSLSGGSSGSLQWGGSGMMALGSWGY